MPPLEAACGGRGVQKAFSIENRRFGRYLRSVRESRRLSLDAVEEMSTGYPERITKSHLSRIENGQAVPTFPRMFALSEIYGVPVSSMAERFEIDLKHGMLSATIQGKSREEAEEEARKARRAGHYREAVGLYEYLMDRCAEQATLETLLGWRLRRAYCLLGLERYSAAKEEFEYLLNNKELSQIQRVQALECLARCCRRTGRFTIALMAIEQARKESRELDDLPSGTAITLFSVHGEVLSALGRADEACSVFDEAFTALEGASESFNLAHLRISHSSALIQADRLDEAKRALERVLSANKDRGFDRLDAIALANLGLISFKQNQLENTEAYCIRSNQIARPHEYISVVFQNCFYLWRVSEARNDRAGVVSNEKTLKTLLRRVGDSEEAEIFRAHLSGVKA
ncbi:hypothetical protein ABI59_22190 [Acidobacteria bacterium Mor1]|nr:hypothetical protein ABI59_22190 [Acidobacteria bacterium Mor1]